MSTVGLFALGTVVTLIVGVALALLVWGAILDGRDIAERESADEDAGASRGVMAPTSPAST